MASDLPNPALAVAMALGVGLPLFVGFWLLVTGVLASLSGWPNLADTFPASERPEGNTLRRAVLKIGAVGENGVTTLRPTAHGLYMSANPLFRFRRPAVLVPWNRIRFVKWHRILWQRSATLDLGGITSMRVRARVLPTLREYGVQVPDRADP